MSRARRRGRNPNRWTWLRGSFWAASVLLAHCGCARAPEGPWLVQPEAPALRVEPAPTPPPEGSWNPRLVLEPGSEQAATIRASWTIRQRGPEVAATPFTVDEALDVQVRVLDRSEQGSVLRVQVTDAEVGVDPPLEVLQEDLRDARLADALQVALDSGGRIVRATPQPRRSEPAVRARDSDLAGYLKRLWPTWPDHPVQVADTWQFEAVWERVSGSGLEYRSSGFGRYRFRGLSVLDGRAVAVLDLDYDVTVTGHGDRSVRVRGTGVGRGVFLVDAETAQVVQAEVVESVHSVVEWPARRRTLKAEQLTRGVFEWVAVAGGD